MHKSLYSLMLMDRVVEEIDRMAIRQNTNRSNMVNQILAEYVSMMTPERRIGGIYKQIEEIIAESRELVAAVAQRNGALSVKSNLDYKYRPTVRYDVQLYRDPGDYIGELNVVFRTQSGALILALEEFFEILGRVEGYYRQNDDFPIKSYFADGRYTRSISIPRNSNYSGEELGRAISGYIEMLDRVMKCYISRRYTPKDVEAEYIAYLKNNRIVI